MKIHKIIRENRKAKGLTQEELARYLGVSTPAVNKWEKGLSYPDITMLPVLAAYFNLSVDELLGYEPQLNKEEIEKLYHHFADEFGKKPFDEVKKECGNYIKKYHACFPFLLQMAVLYLNHLSIAPQQQELLMEIMDILDGIIRDCEDIRIAKDASLVKGGCYLAMRQPEELLDLLGSEIQAFSQEGEMQAQAYQLRGEYEKAEEFLQVCMYQYLLSLAGDAGMLAAWKQEQSEGIDEMVRRTLQVMDIFQMEKLHFNVTAQVYLSFARYYCVSNRPKEALALLDKYVSCAESLEYPIKLHGDIYFDKVDRWLEKLDLGKEAPRGADMVKQSILQSVVQNPSFQILAEDAAFLHLVKRLEKSCETCDRK